jgi:pimeloyl-ACP methyl ester carboxylesterase
VIKENLLSEKIPYTNALFNLTNPATAKLIVSLNGIEFSSKLNRVTKPVLVLSGNYDFVVPPAVGDDMFAKVSSTVKSRKIFMNTGHNLEEQAGYATAFLQFIDANK